ncbi:MAG: efflux RND transporter periplasmic adaptor subunit [Parcubacteria group bacterium]
MSKKKIFLTLAAVSAVSATFIFMRPSAKNTDAADTDSAKKVSVAEISLADFSPQSPYCGFATGAQRAEIMPEINGTVQKLFKNEGETVRAGEIVAIVDNSILDAQVSSSSKVAQDSNKIYTDTKKLYEQKVDEAKVALKKSKASFDSGDATKEDVKLAEEAVDSAKRARDLQIATARVQVSGAEGQSLVAGSYAQKQTIRAPFSGTITQKHTTVGSFISAGMPVYSLSAPGTIEIELSAPKSIIEKLSPNQKISITKKGSLATIGFVFAKNPFLNFGSPNGIVRLRMENPAETSVSIGDYVCADFPLSQPKEALAIPESSILHEFGDSFVFTVENNIAHKKNVVTGATAASKTEIISGLQPGETIITQGIYEISDNNPIIY